MRPNTKKNSENKQKCQDIDETMIWLWLCAISHIFDITGSDVKLVSDFAGKIPFSDKLQYRRKRFFDGLRCLNNSVIQFMSSV